MRKGRVAIVIVLLAALSIVAIFYVNKKGDYPQKTYDETKTPLENKLMQYDYEIPKESDNEQMIYLIKGTEENLDFKKIKVSNNEEINVKFKKNDRFVISLHANKTVSAKWNLIINDEGRKTLKLENEAWLDNFKPVPKDSTGVSYARQFFTLTALDIGKASLEFIYKSTDIHDEISKPFKIKINIEITE